MRPLTGTVKISAENSRLRRGDDIPGKGHLNFTGICQRKFGFWLVVNICFRKSNTVRTQICFCVIYYANDKKAKNRQFFQNNMRRFGFWLVDSLHLVASKSVLIFPFYGFNPVIPIDNLLIGRLLFGIFRIVRNFPKFTLNFFINISNAKVSSCWFYEYLKYAHET